MSVRCLGALVALLASASACHRTWDSRTVQPALRLGQTTEARTSFTNEILTRDMEFGRRLYLTNSAYFVVVSKDRLRFHVRLVHKWKQIADPSRWRVWLEDDLGHRFYPEAIDRRSVKRVTRVEIRSWGAVGPGEGRRDQYARCPCVYKIGGLHKANSYPLLSYTIWRGDGDYTFYRRDIYRRDMRRLTLVMERRGYTYRYSWRFAGGEETAAEAVSEI